ncbi:hydroxyisourate hydrolase [Penaeicola halotolerans]|uniref:hydroxyisourate hydrolase n=1 Tax=Penaeicola halotolerans TaxID=2793196 RepID=UPI001CF8B50F|nr:hydroxyisourate hydrolase [Penaeicola halotolerans]
MIATLVMCLFVVKAFAQVSTHQLSSHILDISLGKPASGVKISLSKQNQNGSWQVLEEKVTDQDGRIKDFLKMDKGKEHLGIYKLTYYTKPYFEKQDLSSFYPFIEVVFELKDNEHYHVPITLSPFGYSTYRGS